MATTSATSSSTTRSKAGWLFFETAWKVNEQVDLAAVSAAAAKALPEPVGPGTVDMLAEAYLRAGVETERELAEGVLEVLADLRQRDISMAVICDVGTVPSSHIRVWLDELGVAPFNDAHAFSDEVGVFKPHRAMFDAALSALGVEAGAAAHVGDIKRTDVQGARAAGMTTVRYRGVRDDPEDGDEADHVIVHHAQLPEVLGLG